MGAGGRRRDGLRERRSRASSLPTGRRVASDGLTVGAESPPYLFGEGGLEFGFVGEGLAGGEKLHEIEDLLDGLRDVERADVAALGAEGFQRLQEHADAGGAEEFEALQIENDELSAAGDEMLEFFFEALIRDGAEHAVEVNDVGGGRELGGGNGEDHGGGAKGSA